MIWRVASCVWWPPSSSACQRSSHQAEQTPPPYLPSPAGSRGHLSPAPPPQGRPHSTTSPESHWGGDTSHMLITYSCPHSTAVLTQVQIWMLNHIENNTIENSSDWQLNYCVTDLKKLNNPLLKWKITLKYTNSGRRCSWSHINVWERAEAAGL